MSFVPFYLHMLAMLIFSLLSSAYLCLADICTGSTYNAILWSNNKIHAIFKTSDKVCNIVLHKSFPI